jgi:protein-tyrosine phosphatase
MAIGSPRVTRHLDLEALVNVRDLGGYTGRAGQTLRWQRLYRADDLSRATEADRIRLAELGIVTIIDLRTDRERVSSRPPGLLGGADVEVHHLPILLDSQARWGDIDRLTRVAGATAEDLLARRSLAMLVEGAPSIADALRVLAQPGSQPAVIQSTLGKDRAGLLAAVILALLGVSTRTIAEDYAESEVAIAVGGQARAANDLGDRAGSWDASTALLAAPPGAIVRVLDQVNQRCGSMVGFARGIGVEFEVIEALHRQMLV